MSMLFVALPVTLLLVGAAVVIFVWAARSGQFDDLETPAVRMLHDDETPSQRPEASPAEDSEG